MIEVVMMIREIIQNERELRGSLFLQKNKRTRAFACVLCKRKAAWGQAVGVIQYTGNFLCTIFDIYIENIYTE